MRLPDHLRSLGVARATSSVTTERASCQLAAAAISQETRRGGAASASTCRCGSTWTRTLCCCNTASRSPRKNKPITFFQRPQEERRPAKVEGCMLDRTGCSTPHARLVRLSPQSARTRRSVCLPRSARAADRTLSAARDPRNSCTSTQRGLPRRAHPPLSSISSENTWRFLPSLIYFWILVSTSLSLSLLLLNKINQKINHIIHLSGRREKGEGRHGHRKGVIITRVIITRYYFLAWERSQRESFQEGLLSHSST